MTKNKIDKDGAFDEAAIFKQMVESAFDFLNQARSDLEKKPKYAIIHFATAIELILKARLLKEHWALVVAASGDADRHAFKNGTAKTVTVDQAVKRLENIADQQLPTGAQDAFKIIAAHRNRMIHFFHEAASEEAEEAARAKITAELLLGWYFLLRIFTNWADAFAGYEGNIWQASNAMRGTRAYLKIVYEKAQPQIAELAAKETEFCDCSSCGYPSARLDPYDDAIADLICLVCCLRDSLLTMPCPQEDCHGTLRLTGYNMGDEPCGSCNQQVEKDQIAEFLDTEQAEYPEITVKNCGLCITPGAVVEHDEIYVCTHCLSHDEEIATCGWCNEMQLGYELENSYYSGCEFCDGKGGWDAD